VDPHCDKLATVISRTLNIASIVISVQPTMINYLSHRSSTLVKLSCEHVAMIDIS